MIIKETTASLNSQVNTCLIYQDPFSSNCATVLPGISCWFVLQGPEKLSRGTCTAGNGPLPGCRSHALRGISYRGSPTLNLVRGTD